MADSEDVLVQFITWDEPRQAPLRAARRYYYDTGGAAADETDGSFGYVICAYADWVLAPSLAGLLYGGVAEDGDSVTPETPADPSSVVGVYRPGQHAIFRGLYEGSAHDEDGLAQEGGNPSMVVGHGYHRTIYLPFEFHRFMIGDEGVVIEPCINPRGKAGAPTLAGLARYATGENCSPRAGAGSDSCEGR